MKTQTYLFVVYCLFIVMSCNRVDHMVEKIAHSNILECEYVGGFASHPSKQYKRYKKLSRIASPEKLIQLTDHDSAAVAIYASHALIQRELIAPDLLFSKFLQKDKYVSTSCGCLLSSSSASWEVYMEYRSLYHEFLDVNTGEYIIHDTPELFKMDSMVLFANRPDAFLYYVVFQDRKFPEEFNKRILDLAFNEQNYYALTYVFEHLKNDHTGLLIETLNLLLEKKSTESYQKTEIEKMLESLDKNYRIDQLHFN